MKYHLMSSSFLVSIACFLATDVQAQSDVAQSFTESSLTSEWNESPNRTQQTLSDKLGASVGQVWINSYDTNSKLVSIQGPDESTARAEWVDEFTKKITNAVGHAWVFTYDDSGRLLSRSSPGNITDSLVYDVDGLISSLTTEGSGGRLRTEYKIGESGSLEGILMPSGRIARINSDDERDISLIKASINNLEILLRSDRLDTYATDLAPSNFSQVLIDRLTTLRSPIDPSREEPEVARVQTKEGGAVEVGYDDFGRLDRVSDPRNVATTYEYDGFGRVVRETSPDSGTVIYTRTAAGHVAKAVRNNELTITREFDALGRVLKEVTERQGSKRSTREFLYDECLNGVSRLCSITSQAEVTTFEYTALGYISKRVTEYRDASGRKDTTTFFYDNAGRLESIGYPSGVTINYSKGDDGSIRQVGASFNGTKFSIAQDISTNAVSGRLTEVVYANGVRTKSLINESGLLAKTSTLVGEKIIGSAEYSFDQENRITGIKRADPQLSQEFTYDIMGRLVGERRGTGANGERVFTYGYDLAGNRVSRSDGNDTKQLEYDMSSNRLSKMQGKEVLFDSMGNMTLDKNGKRAFEYDNQNRMSVFIKNGKPRARYTYDAYGRRIQKTLLQNKHALKYKTFNASYMPDGRLLGELVYDEDGLPLFSREYVWIGTMPIAQIELKFHKKGGVKGQPSVTFIHHDHRNSPLFATNPEGEIVWRLESTAFGIGEEIEDPDGDGIEVDIPLRMPGQYFDKESKLFYNGQRDYDPELGRYIQADPTGLLAGINRYSYVENDPVNKIDSTGLDGGTIATVIAVVDAVRLVLSIVRFFKSLFGGGSSGSDTPIKRGPTYESGYYQVMADCREPGVSCDGFLGDYGRAVTDRSDRIAAISLKKKNAPEEESYCSIEEGRLIGNNPDQDFFFRLRLVRKSGNRLLIYPRSVSLPDVSIPNTVGAEGFNTLNLNDHVYNYFEDTRNLNLSPTKVGNSIAKFPTPKNSISSRPTLAATPSGTRNDVGLLPIVGGKYLGGNWVKSFRITSPQPDRYTDIALNYTVKNQHWLDEGYVMRTGIVEKGRVVGIRTYGEGEGFFQDPNIVSRAFWCPQIPVLWDPVNERVLRDLNSVYIPNPITDPIPYLSPGEHYQ